MTNIKSKIRRFTYHAKTTYLRSENIILAAALALCALWAVSAVSTMSKNWEGQRTLEATRLEAARLELEIEMERLNQQYYSSAEYKELVARTALGKALEGETLILLPKNSDRALTKDIGGPVIASEAKQSPISNLSEWLRFLF